MKPQREPPVLLFDFDNTITQGDVLDRVIERFSVSDEWRDWEDAWVRGEISTLQCLDRQIEGIRASKAELLDFVGNFPIDPHFAGIVLWAAKEHIDLLIVSDNFSCLVQEILSRNGLSGLPVRANELEFAGNRPEARFPFRSPRCWRCAHCKAQHFTRFPARQKIYVGDGLSDVCPALAADVVFAKDSLAAHLADCGFPFKEFASLETVADYLAGAPQATIKSVLLPYRAGNQGQPKVLVQGFPGDS